MGGWSLWIRRPAEWTNISSHFITHQHHDGRCNYLFSWKYLGTWTAVALEGHPDAHLGNRGGHLRGTCERLLKVFFNLTEISSGPPYKLPWNLKLYLCKTVELHLLNQQNSEQKKKHLNLTFATSFHHQYPTTFSHLAVQTEQSVAMLLELWRVGVVINQTPVSWRKDATRANPALEG